MFFVCLSVFSLRPRNVQVFSLLLVKCTWISCSSYPNAISFNFFHAFFVHRCLQAPFGFLWILLLLFFCATCLLNKLYLKIKRRITTFNAAIGVIRWFTCPGITGLLFRLIQVLLLWTFISRFFFLLSIFWSLGNRKGFLPNILHNGLRVWRILLHLYTASK